MFKRAKNKYTEYSTRQHGGIEYTLCVSCARKTVQISVRRGEVRVMVPLGYPCELADELILRNRDKILKFIEKNEKCRLSAEEEEKAAKRCSEIMPQLTEKYSELTGLAFAGIRFSTAKSYLGCLSPKNVISYSYILGAYPLCVMEYVALHEIAHIKYRNHKKEFYAFIESYMPDYRERLKQMKNTPCV